MEIIYEKELCADTINQIYDIAMDYSCDYFTENFPNDMRLDMTFHRVLYIKEAHEIISCLVFTCLDGSPHITMLATKRERAGQGFGKQLIQAFQEHVTQFGFHSIELFTFSPKSKPLYQSTLAFYENAGFRVIREYQDLWEPGTITLKLRKEWASEPNNEKL